MSEAVSIRGLAANATSHLSSISEIEVKEDKKTSLLPDLHRNSIQSIGEQNILQLLITKFNPNIHKIYLTFQIHGHKKNNKSVCFCRFVTIKKSPHRKESSRSASEWRACSFVSFQDATRHRDEHKTEKPNRY